jgi:hypothetical protein
VGIYEDILVDRRWRRDCTHLVVVRKERVASELGATLAADPRARYDKLTLAFWSVLELAGAAGGSLVAVADAIL